MVPFTLGQAFTACGGKYSGGSSALSEFICGVTIDSRKIEPGFLFIPVRGEHHDGHDFIQCAFEAGALCCLTEKPLQTDHPTIFVPSALDALQSIAACYRSLFPVPAIAISGSVGKTTTKELIASVLSQKYTILKSEGNLNNQTGVPQTIFRLDKSHQAAVIEMGMNHFGEIASLAKIVRPKICVLTNIGEAHLEYLGSKEGILQAKSEMFEFMEDDGTIVLNGDDPLLATIKNKYPQQVITFGFGDGNQIQAKECSDFGLAGTQFTACYDGKSIRIQSPCPGKHMIYNSLAAFAVGLLMGVSEQQIQTGIRSFIPASGRMHVIETGYITILNDAYNANPTSMAAAINVTACAPGRSVCILGDMFELGKNEIGYHKQIGRFAGEKGIGLILCVGKLSRYIYESALAEGGNALYYPDKELLLRDLPALIRPKDTVLVKASHGMHLDSVVQWLEENRK
ncbi:MAG: UDP-N-acetylmuramoyl-tripeptide--D-alanyl-D-alanine ligase [Christensenellales bacterium]